MAESNKSLWVAACAFAGVVLVAGCGTSGKRPLSATGRCTIGGKLRLVGEGVGSTEGGVTWSPNSKKLAFPSDRTGVALIYTVNADGTDLRRLTDSGNDGTPAWSPDGRTIAFVSEASNFTPDIYLMKADGSDQRQLTRSNDYPGPTDPAWSPDGRNIAFIDENHALEVMRSDGSQRELVNSPPATSPLPSEDSSPAWSPDGGTIVFAQTKANRSLQIYIVNADGSGKHQLTQQGLNAFPSWSPDGRRVLFSHLQSKKHGSDFNVELYAMNANGTHQQRLTTGKDDTGYWAPNGRQIAISRGDRVYVTTIRCR
jgi:Tol biopolymer transport system component